MSETMELTRDTLEAIGGYVKQNLATWIRDVERQPQTDPYLLERIVRVEDELRSSRELMQQGFALMEKRFEAVDKRFEAVDQRFEAVDQRFADLRGDMIARFEAVDKRFEAVDKRFEAVDKRFEDLRTDMNARFIELRSDMKDGFERTDRHMNRWMTMLTIVIAVAALAGPLIAAFLS